MPRLSNPLQYPKYPASTTGCINNLHRVTSLDVLVTSPDVLVNLSPLKFGTSEHGVPLIVLFYCIKLHKL